MHQFACIIIMLQLKSGARPTSNTVSTDPVMVTLSPFIPPTLLLLQVAWSTISGMSYSVLIFLLKFRNPPSSWWLVVS